MLPFAIMLSCLLISHGMFLFTNQATIDLMKGNYLQIPLI